MTASSAPDWDHRACGGARRVRTDVSAKIETGDSWQLPIFIAHLLASMDRLSGSDRAPVTIWSTGSLSHGGAVKSVGEIARKVDTARETLNAALSDGQRVYAVLPPGNRAAFEAADPPPGIAIMTPDCMGALKPLLQSLIKPTAGTVRETPTAHLAPRSADWPCGLGCGVDRVSSKRPLAAV